MKQMHLNVLGRILIGLSITGIGITHFLVSGVPTILLPLSPEEVWHPLSYIFGIFLILAGIILIIDRWTVYISIGLAVFFLLLILAVHLPNRLSNHPENLAFWTDPLKLLAMSGGLLLIIHNSAPTSSNRIQTGILKIAPNGKFLFAFMLLIFGIDHFLYIDFIHKMVPSWIPFPVFWTYFTGAALIGTAMAITFNKLLKPVQFLFILMLLIWLVTIHIPATIAAPPGNTGDLIGTLTNVYFIGIAMLLRSDQNKAAHY